MELSETLPVKLNGTVNVNCPPYCAEVELWNQPLAASESGIVNCDVCKVVPAEGWNVTPTCVKSRVLAAPVICNWNPLAV